MAGSLSISICSPLSLYATSHLTSPPPPPPPHHLHLHRHHHHTHARTCSHRCPTPPSRSSSPSWCNTRRAKSRLAGTSSVDWRRRGKRPHATCYMLRAYVACVRVITHLLTHSLTHSLCMIRTHPLTHTVASLRLCSYGVGARLIESISAREKCTRRETRVVNILQVFDVYNYTPVYTFVYKYYIVSV